MEVGLLNRDESGRWKLNMGAIRDALSEFTDAPVAVVCVYGHKRTGKSFVINKVLHYLQLCSVRTRRWLQLASGTGRQVFASRGGDHGCTEGIRIWSRCFPALDVNGVRYGVLLLDTQGCFDAVARAEDDVAVFALAATLCSVLVLNVRKGLDEGQWRVIDEFLRCARPPGSTVQSQRSFQKAIFLMRDWQSPKSYPYGKHTVESNEVCKPEAERNFLKKCILNETDLDATAVDRRRHLWATFETIEAFLLPHPGDEIAEWDEDDPCPNMDPEFEEHLGGFVETLLDADQLERKQLWGEPMTGGMLLDWLGVVSDEIAVSGFHLRTIGDATCSYFRQCCRTSHRTALMSLLSICMPSRVTELEKYNLLELNSTKTTFRSRLVAHISEEKLEKEEILLEKILSRCYNNFKTMTQSLDALGRRRRKSLFGNYDENVSDFKRCQLNLLMACADLCRCDQGDEVFVHLRTLCINCRKAANLIKDLRHELIRLGTLGPWQSFVELVKRSEQKTIVHFRLAAKKVADENRMLLGNIDSVLQDTDIYNKDVCFLHLIYDPGYTLNLLTDLGGELERVEKVTPLICSRIESLNDWFEICVESFKANLNQFL